MYTKYFFITICLLAFTFFRAQNDGTTLNVRLYPVQTLAINPITTDSDDKNNTDESKFVMISSPSGFEIKMQQNVYDQSAGFKDVDYEKLSQGKDKVHNLIKYKKGVIEKIFEFSHHAKDTKTSHKSSADQEYYVLTMMSK